MKIGTLILAVPLALGGGVALAQTASTTTSTVTTPDPSTGVLSSNAVSHSVDANGNSSTTRQSTYRNVDGGASTTTTTHESSPAVIPAPSQPTTVIVR